MYNRQFWNRVAGIAAGLSLAVYLFFNWVVYPAFVYQVKSVEALKRELHQQPGILVTEFGALQVSDKTYTVHLDGRNRVANKIGYDIDGRYSFLDAEALLTLIGEVRAAYNEDYTNVETVINDGGRIMRYRDISIAIFECEAHIYVITATAPLGNFLYRYELILPIDSSAAQRAAGTDIVITLSKELVDLYFKNNY